MNCPKNQSRRTTIFSRVLKGATLLSIVLGSAQLTDQASAQFSCTMPFYRSSDPFEAPNMWLAHVSVSTKNQFGLPVVLDGSGFLVSPHAMLLPASMLYQRGDLPNSANVKPDAWIGSVSEYRITPDARMLDPHATEIHAPYGSRTPSRRVMSRDFRTWSSPLTANKDFNWGALQFDCPFAGLGTGIPVSFRFNPLGRVNSEGYRDFGVYYESDRYFAPTRLHFDYLSTWGSKRFIWTSNNVNLTQMLPGTGAWKLFGDIDYGTGQVELDYGLVGLFTTAYASNDPDCSTVTDTCCSAAGPFFNDVGNRADSIREIMNWRPEDDCNMPMPLPWHLLMEHVRNVQPEMLLPLEQLNLTPDANGQLIEPVSHTMQVIEHTFYEWFVYTTDPLDPSGPRAVRMVAPENRWLSVEEAQTLISASINWTSLNPPLFNPTEIEIDPTIPSFNTMVVTDEPSDSEDQGAGEDHIEEMLVDDGQDDGSQFDPADLNQDGSVNGADLASLLGEWGNQGGSADIDGNGLVEGGDLALLLGRWQ